MAARRWLPLGRHRCLIRIDMHHRLFILFPVQTTLYSRQHIVFDELCEDRQLGGLAFQNLDSPV